MSHSAESVIVNVVHKYGKIYVRAELTSNYFKAGISFQIMLQMLQAGFLLKKRRRGSAYLVIVFNIYYL